MLSYHIWTVSIEFADFYKKFGPTSHSNFLLQGVSSSDGINHNTFIFFPPQSVRSKQHSVLVPHVHEYNLVGSISGILCLQRMHQNEFCQFVLCNPLTGQKIDTVSPARRMANCECFLLDDSKSFFVLFICVKNFD